MLLIEDDFLATFDIGDKDRQDDNRVRSGNIELFTNVAGVEPIGDQRCFFLELAQAAAQAVSSASRRPATWHHSPSSGSPTRRRMRTCHSSLSFRNAKQETARLLSFTSFFMAAPRLSQDLDAFIRLQKEGWNPQTNCAIDAPNLIMLALQGDYPCPAPPAFSGMTPCCLNLNSPKKNDSFATAPMPTPRKSSCLGSSWPTATRHLTVTS